MYTSRVRRSTCCTALAVLMPTVYGPLCAHAATRQHWSARLSTPTTRLMERQRRVIDSDLRRHHKRYTWSYKMLSGTDNGGVLTACFRNGHIVKLYIWVGLSSHNVVDTLYFQQGKLMLVVDQDQRYWWDEKKGALDPGKFREVREQRFYFQQGDIVGWFKQGKRVDLAKNEVSRAKEHDTWIDNARTYIGYALSRQQEIGLNE